MTLRGMLWRACAALLVAATGIGVLAHSLRESGASAPRQPLRAGPARVPVPVTNVPPLGRIERTVQVCTDERQVPADAAPLVRVLRDGSLALVRPAPLAQRPGQSVHTVPAVVLSRPVAALSPAERGALLECLGALLPERPVPLDAVHVVGDASGARELVRLLPWLP